MIGNSAHDRMIQSVQTGLHLPAPVAPKAVITAAIVIALSRSAPTVGGGQSASDSPRKNTATFSVPGFSSRQKAHPSAFILSTSMKASDVDTSGFQPSVLWM